MVLANKEEIKIMETKVNLKHAEAVRAYVISAIDCSGTDEQKVKYFFKNFKVEYDHDYNVKRYPNLQNRISEYLMGLPSTLSIEFSYYGIEKLLRQWDYVTDNTTEKQLDEQLESYWKYLAMALIVLGRRAGIKDIKGL